MGPWVSLWPRMDISSRALHETLEFDGIWGIPSTCWSDPILYTTRLNHGFSWIFHFASCRRRVFRSSCTVRSLVANVNILNVSLFAYIFAVCMHIYIYILSINICIHITYDVFLLQEQLVSVCQG